MLTQFFEAVTAFALVVIAILLFLNLLLGARRFGRYRKLFGFPFRLRKSWDISSPIFDIIDKAESRHKIELTWGAREMLAIPVIESSEREEIDWKEVDLSVNMVVEAMALEDQDSKLLLARYRNSVSVIRGFYNRFCKIPPFCNRRG